MEFKVKLTPDPKLKLIDQVRQFLHDHRYVLINEQPFNQGSSFESCKIQFYNTNIQRIERQIFRYSVGHHPISHPVSLSQG